MGFVGRGSSCVWVCWCVCAVEEAACWCVRCVDVATRRWQHLCVCARVRVCTWVLRPAPPRGGWWSWSRSMREVCRVGGRLCRLFVFFVCLAEPALLWFYIPVPDLVRSILLIEVLIRELDIGCKSDQPKYATHLGPIRESSTNKNQMRSK